MQKDNKPKTFLQKNKKKPATGSYSSFFKNKRKKSDEEKPNKSPLVKGDLAYDIIDEAEEIIYEDRDFNSMSESRISNYMNNQESPQKSVHSNSRKDSLNATPREQKKMKPKLSYKQLINRKKSETPSQKDMSEEKEPEKEEVPVIQTTVPNNMLKTKTIPVIIETESKNMLNTKTEPKILLTPVSSKKEEPQKKMKNFIKQNKQMLALKTNEKNNQVKLKDNQEIREMYQDKVKFEHTLRTDTLEENRMSKRIDTEPDSDRKDSKGNDLWRYTYKIEKGEKGSAKKDDDTELDVNDHPKEWINPLPHYKLNEKEIIRNNRIIIGRYDEMLTSFKTEYDILLRYCDELHLNLQDILYSFDEFKRRFNNLLDYIKEIRDFQATYNNTETKSEIGRYDATINQHEKQIKDILDLFDYLENLPSNDFFYKKVIVKSNKNFFNSFGRNITKTFPANLVNVYCLRLLIELHETLNLGLANICVKPLKFREPLMHIRKFLLEFKKRNHILLKTQQELGQYYNHIEEVNLFYYDFADAFKKNQIQTKKMVQKYKSFPMKKNFFNMKHRETFRKVKFNFNREFV